MAFSFFMLLSFKAYAVEEEWLRLLHYKNGRSEIDSASFFFTKTGYKNPKLELERAKEVFFGEKNKTLICKFPARYEYLRRVYKHDGPGILKNCEKLQAFLKKVNLEKVSVVFSSYYMSNPSSTFGHTFLKLSGKKYLKEEDPLLSYGVNYAADPQGSMSVFYALKGLFGFFKGTFSMIPYYYKVREYTDYESRDLWIYDLDFNLKEKEVLAHHIWELGEQYANYYFLNKNCSYFVLKIIEVAKLKINLSKKFNWNAIPAETIRELYKEKGFIKKVHFRPSVKTRLENSMNSFKSKDKRRVYSYVKLLWEEKQGDLSFDTKLSDAAIEMYDFLYAKKIDKDEGAFLKKKHPLLVMRSKLETKGVRTKILRSPPHKMHAPAYFSAGYGASKSFRTYNFSGRLSFHSFLEPIDGVMPSGEIILGRFSIGFLENKAGEKKFNLNSLDLVKVSNLSPLKSYEWPTSWKLHVGSRRPLLKEESLEHFLGLYGGVSLEFAKRSQIYGFTYGELNFNDQEHFKFQNRVGTEFGIRSGITRNFFILFEAKFFYKNSFKSVNFESVSSSLELKSQWTLDNWAIRTGIEKEISFYRGSFELLHYF